MDLLIHIFSISGFFAVQPSVSQEEPQQPVLAEYDENHLLRLHIGKSFLRIGGYVETFYSYNFNRPSNGITNYRAFDNRHNSLTLQNVALDSEWDSPYIVAHIALQAGHAPAIYYGASEPSMAGSGSGAANSNASLWQYVQQANLGIHLPVKIPITIDAGLFLSSIGPESLITHDNWTWSQTPLFFALPFYHLGVRGSVSIRPQHFLRLGVYNGWNNIVDNNKEKSLALEYNFHPSKKIDFTAIYFSGVERPRGAPEGRAWRHMFDTYLRSQLVNRLALLAHACGGLEPNRFGLSWWTVGSLGLRVKAMDWLYFAGQGAFLYEYRAANGSVLANSILLPATWLGAGIFTVDFRWLHHLSIKLEYRHDHAPTQIFFAGTVQGDGSERSPFLPNSIAQNTITLGGTAWF